MLRRGGFETDGKFPNDVEYMAFEIVTVECMKYVIRNRFIYIYTSTEWAVHVIYVLKYLEHWGLNFESQSKQERVYITENSMIPKINKKDASYSK